MEKNLENHSHRRFNILTGEWILVSPHRTKRPWLGQEEKKQKEKKESYLPDCYLCPGNTRANGKKNPDYKSTFVFQNDFAALLKDNPEFTVENGLIRAESERGICKVLCFSPDHSKSLALMSVEEIKEVISVWQSEYKSLGNLDFINHIQIFENKGSVMGASNPHPHGQIWAQSSIPNEARKKDKNQREYHNKNKKSLLGDYLLEELENNERTVYENEDFVVLVPFWAIWPFETMIIPKEHQINILKISRNQKKNFADAIKVLTSLYNSMFDISFPYSAGISQAFTDGKDNSHWHWHMSFLPPLLESPTQKKFMVGYEMMAMPQRDFTAEYAAEKLRRLLKKRG